MIKTYRSVIQASFPGLVITGLLLTSFSCGKKDASKNLDGTCNSSFVGDYNSTANAVNAANLSYADWDFRPTALNEAAAQRDVAAADSACTTLFKIHDGAKCSAIVKGTAAEREVTLETLRADCEAIKNRQARFEKMMAARVTTTALTPATATETVPVVRADGTCGSEFLRAYTRVQAEFSATAKLVSQTTDVARSAAVQSGYARLDQACTDLHRQFFNTVCTVVRDLQGRFSEKLKSADWDQSCEIARDWMELSRHS